MMYDNHHDAATYLSGTVVLYKGDPMMVRDVIDVTPIILDCLALPKQSKRFPIELGDPHLNYTTFNLGYMNPDTDRGVNQYPSAVYVSRTPARRVQQGLSGNNCVGRYQDPQRGVRSVPGHHLFGYAGFRDMLQGNYPSFEEASAILEKDTNRTSVAFHKRFALYKDRDLGFYEIHYKGMRVGWGTLTNMILPTEYCWLREMISEVGIKVKEA